PAAAPLAKPVSPAPPAAPAASWLKPAAKSAPPPLAAPPPLVAPPPAQPVPAEAIVETSAFDFASPAPAPSAIKPEIASPSAQNDPWSGDAVIRPRYRRRGWTWKAYSFLAAAAALATTLVIILIVNLPNRDGDEGGNGDKNAEKEPAPREI